MILVSSFTFLLRILGSIAIGNLLIVNCVSDKKPSLLTTNLCLGLSLNVIIFYWLLPFPNLASAILNGIQIIAISAFLFQKGFHNIRFLTKKDSNVKLHTLFLICLGIACFYVIASNVSKPHGGWDAFAMWNLKANFLSNNVNFWSSSNTELVKYIHVDYPLLLPSAISFLSFSPLPQIAPIFLCLLFTIGTSLLFLDPIFTVLSSPKRLMACLVLMVNLSFLKFGSNQYADIPLAFFLLAGILSILKARESHNLKLYLLAGMFLGAQLWTKNEGALYLVLLVLITSFSIITNRDLNKKRKAFVAILTGILPFLLTLFHFKTSVMVSNDLSINSPSDYLEKMTDSSRYLTILSRFTDTTVNLSSTIFQPVILFIIAIAVIYINRTSFQAHSNTSSWLGWFLIVSIAAFFGIYLITPQNLNWHLNTSLNRIFMQVLPIFVLYAMLALPDKFLQEISISFKRSGKDRF